MSDNVQATEDEINWLEQFICDQPTIHPVITDDMAVLRAEKLLSALTAEDGPFTDSAQRSVSIMVLRFVLGIDAFVVRPAEE